MLKQALVRCTWTIVFVVLLLFFPAVSAWVSQRNNKCSTITMYMPPAPTSLTSPITKQTIPKKTGEPREFFKNRKIPLQLSSSVLASCDTLPSFQTAHGLLSPETVMRLDEMTRNGNRSEAIKQFLNTYRTYGPLACVPMLSDPILLPQLTQALRDLTS